VLDALRREKEAETARSESLALELEALRTCEQQKARDEVSENHNVLLAMRREAEQHLEDANALRAELVATVQADAEKNDRLASAKQEAETLRQMCQRLERDIGARDTQIQTMRRTLHNVGRLVGQLDGHARAIAAKSARSPVP
jgi:seryl-tRNA synthetase